MTSIPRELDLLRSLQERAARAQPAEYVRDLGGWRLGSAPGCSWWVSTVLPHAAPGPGELAHRVDLVEQFYADHATTVSFQITPGVCPDGLDALLAERGFRPEGPVSLQVASTARVLGRASKVLLEARLDESTDPSLVRGVAGRASARW